MKEKSEHPANSGTTYEIGYKRPPKKNQFGQPGGNPRHNGNWRKEDTPRYKLEKMITMTDSELEYIVANPESPTFEKSMADILLQTRSDVDGDGTPRAASLRFQAIEKIINQVYGVPQATNINLNAEVNDKEKSGFIKGFYIPGDADDITATGREG